jgi:LysM repeat protein
MKPFFERINSIIPARKKPEAEQPQEVSAANEPITTPRKERKADRFTLISWGATSVLVVGLLGGTLYYKSTLPPVIITAPAVTEEASSDGSVPLVVDAGTGGDGSGLFPTIFRKLQVKTNIPERPRYDSELYRVVRGDSMYRIAETFKVKSETILYVNDQLEDNPHSLRPGMELMIPPEDGLYYEWKEGDTFEAVAKKFFAEPDDIINFPGNQIDLTDPKVEPGTKISVTGQRTCKLRHAV